MSLRCSALDSAVAAAQAAGNPFFSSPSECWELVDAHKATPQPLPSQAPQGNRLQQAFAVGDPQTLAKTGTLISAAELVRRTVTTPGLTSTLTAMAHSVNPWRKAVLIGTVAAAAVGAVKLYLDSKAPVAANEGDEDKAKPSSTVHTESAGATQANASVASADEPAEPAPEPQAAGGADGCGGHDLGEFKEQMRDIAKLMREVYGDATPAISPQDAVTQVDKLLDLLRKVPKEAEDGALVKSRVNAWQFREGPAFPREELVKDLLAISAVVDQLNACDADLLGEYALQATSVALTLAPHNTPDGTPPA